MEKDNIGQFSAGVMYSQLDKFGGNLNLAIPNFRGAGQEFDANVEFSKYRQDFSVGFTEPWMFDRPQSFSARGFFNRTIYHYEDGDTISSYGVRLGTGRYLKWPDDYWRLNLSYQISKEQERGVSRDLARFNLREKGILSKVWLTLSRDATDRPMFPTSGSKFHLTSEIAGLGGDYNYFKETAGYEMYFPLIGKLVFGTQGKVGLLGGFTDNPSISRYDLFAAGGVIYDGIIRGYSEAEFGRVRDLDLGTAMMTFSSGLRYPVIDQQLYLKAFVDMGNTWASLSDVDPTDLYTGVGVGVSLLFPMIGLLDFDLGWALDDAGADAHSTDGVKPKFQFHFNMGRGF
jgi:outer membrane protein insertion porin family